MLRSLLRLCVGLLLLSLLTACLSPGWTSRPWTYGDLRVLDAADAISPSVDILAVYLRRNVLEVEIRVDLLDLTFSDSYSLQLRIRDEHNYRIQPLQIIIPAQETVRVESPGSVKPRVVRDPWLDTITVRLDTFSLGQDIRVDVAAYLPDATTPADEVLDVREDALPPPRAPLLLVFWKVFPASTPAQALRRWDGAHSGPDGARHGLRYLVENAEVYGVPLALLDLKTPSSLAAFHFLQDKGVLPRLVEKRLLILPEVAYSQPAEVSLAFSRQAGRVFDLPSSAFLYAPGGGPTPILPNRFLPLADDSHLFRQGIPLPRRDPNAQVSLEGLTLEVRRDLIATAISPDPSDLVIVGAALTDSNWGNADYANAAFAWITAHPWIWVLGGEDLQAFPRQRQGAVLLPEECARGHPLYTTSGQLLAEDSLVFQSALLEALRTAPANEVTRTAWQLYLDLTACSREESVVALRAQYLGLVADLLAAARWAETPYTATTCDTDLDGDGEPECLLANDVLFAILDADGARLTFLFWRDGQRVRQLVGPTAQFVQALSDPSLWRLEYGMAADPQAVLGGFVDTDQPFAPYRLVQSGEQTVTFLSLANQRLKTYTLRGDALEVTYRSSPSTTILLPLAVDPTMFFFGGAAYRGEQNIGGWQWGVAAGPQVLVSTPLSFEAHGFNASWPLLTRPEDPNLDYPVGHYYPFPLGMMILSGERDFSTLIRPIP